MSSSSSKAAFSLQIKDDNVRCADFGLIICLCQHLLFVFLYLIVVVVISLISAVVSYIPAIFLLLLLTGTADSSHMSVWILDCF